MRVAPGQPFKLNELKEFLNPVGNVGPRRTVFSRTYAQSEGHILEDGHVSKERVVLEDKSHLPLPDGHASDIVLMKENLGVGTGIGNFQACNDSQ